MRNIKKSSLSKIASYQKYAENILRPRNEFQTRFGDLMSLENKFPLFSSRNIMPLNYMRMEVID